MDCVHTFGKILPRFDSSKPNLTHPTCVLSYFMAKLLSNP